MTDFTPEYIAKQRALAADEALPWRVRDTDDPPFMRIWTGNWADGWEICRRLAPHEANYLVAAANGYIPALDEIERLQAELAALKEANRWIPVSERLPEENGEYWTIVNVYSHPESHSFRNGEWRISAGYGITHWRPISVLIDGEPK